MEERKSTVDGDDGWEVLCAAYEYLPGYESATPGELAAMRLILKIRMEISGAEEWERDAREKKEAARCESLLIQNQG